MYVLQSDTHRAHGDPEILETGEKVEKVVWSEGQLGRLYTMGDKAQCSNGQCRGQGRGGKGTT